MAINRPERQSNGGTTVDEERKRQKIEHKQNMVKGYTRSNEEEVELSNIKNEKKDQNNKKLGSASCRAAATEAPSSENACTRSGATTVVTRGRGRRGQICWRVVTDFSTACETVRRVTKRSIHGVEFCQCCDSSIRGLITSGACRTHTCLVARLTQSTKHPTIRAGSRRGQILCQHWARSTSKVNVNLDNTRAGYRPRSTRS